MSKRNFYSQLEKDIILELVNKYRDILECKKTDFRSIKSKNNTWEKATKEFNAQSDVIPRDCKQVNLRKSVLCIRYLIRGRKINELMIICRDCF